MVGTEHAPRWQQLRVPPAMSQPLNAVSSPFQWMFKLLHKAHVTRVHQVCSRAENSAI